jgi:hypothetical protein
LIFGKKCKRKTVHSGGALGEDLGFNFEKKLYTTKLLGCGIGSVRREEISWGRR